MSDSPFQPLTYLAKELESCGLETSIDVSVSVVDAWLPEGARLAAGLVGSCYAGSYGDYRDDFQRAVLRADAITCRPWWWLLWPEERFDNETVEPEITRLVPVEQTPDAARRIRNSLILTDTVPLPGSGPFPAPSPRTNI